MKPKPSHRWVLVLAFLVGFLALSLVLSGIAGLFSNNAAKKEGRGNVALIPVEGVILATTSEDTVFRGENVASSAFIVEAIREAEEDMSVRALVFEINSPGGSAVASDEIGSAIKLAKKPTVAWIREVGASGGYWVASAADHIIANRMSITGSIGVIGSYLEYPDLLKRFNVTYNRLVGGRYKDAGVPYRHLTGEEERIVQSKIDLIYNYFVEEVALNRNLSYNDTLGLATGMFYLGAEAKDLGLVDELGGEPEVKAYLEAQGIKGVEFVRFEQRVSLFDLLAGLTSRLGFSVGQGIVSDAREGWRIQT